MPRDRDTETEVSISFDKNPLSKNGLSSAQESQLEKARSVALRNRRAKLKAKLEQRLELLRSQLGDLRNDQIERVVTHLIQTEDHHRSKLNDLTESMNHSLQQIHAELHALRKGIEPRSSKSIGTLSDVGSSLKKR